MKYNVIHEWVRITKTMIKTTSDESEQTYPFLSLVEDRVAIITLFYPDFDKFNCCFKNISFARKRYWCEHDSLLYDSSGAKFYKGPKKLISLCHVCHNIGWSSGQSIIMTNWGLLYGAVVCVKLSSHVPYGVSGHLLISKLSDVCSY